MFSDYIYDIFETTQAVKAPDLLIGYAHLAAEKPLPEGCTDKEVVHFISTHYKALVEAYRDHDRLKFAQVVDNCRRTGCQVNDYHEGETC